MDDMARLIQRLEAATSQMARRFAQCIVGMSDGDVTPPQFHILKHLADGRPRRITELAVTHLIQPSAVTAMIDRLEVRGYVTRERDSVDRRIVNVSITPAGAAVFAKAEGAKKEYFRRLLSELELAEVETFVTLFEKLSESAAHADGPLCVPPIDQPARGVDVTAQEA